MAIQQCHCLRAPPPKCLCNKQVLSRVLHRGPGVVTSGRYLKPATRALALPPQQAR